MAALDGTTLGFGSLPGLKGGTHASGDRPAEEPLAGRVELAPKLIEVAEDPCFGELFALSDEERSAWIGEATPGRGDAEQAAHVSAGVHQPCSSPVAISKEPDEVIAKVGRGASQVVAVIAPARPADGDLPERATEAEAGSEHFIDGRVIPSVPQLLVEALDERPGTISVHDYMLAPASHFCMGAGVWEGRS